MSQTIGSEEDIRQIGSDDQPMREARLRKDPHG